MLYTNKTWVQEAVPPLTRDFFEFGITQWHLSFLSSLLTIPPMRSRNSIIARNTKEALRPILAMPEIEMVSLQFGDGVEQRDTADFFSFDHTATRSPGSNGTVYRHRRNRHSVRRRRDHQHVDRGSGRIAGVDVGIAGCMISRLLASLLPRPGCWRN